MTTKRSSQPPDYGAMADQLMCIAATLMRDATADGLDERREKAKRIRALAEEIRRTGVR